MPRHRSCTDLPGRGLAFGLIGLTLAVGCTAPIMPAPRVPAPPMVNGGAAVAPPRAPRATPDIAARTASAANDVVAAGQAYVTALYAADDDTAAQYISGYGDQLRKEEADLELIDLSARPMTWGEAGYTDADPSLEFTEVVARVRSRRTGNEGSVYYKLGFKRSGDNLSIDLYSKRVDVRDAS